METESNRYRQKNGTFASVFAAILSGIDIAASLICAGIFCVILAYGSYDPTGVAQIFYYFLFVVPPAAAGLLHLLAALILLIGGRAKNYHPSWYILAVGLEILLFALIFGFFAFKHITLTLVVVLCAKLLFAVYTVFQIERMIGKHRREKNAQA